MRPWRAGDEAAFEPSAAFAAERDGGFGAWDWSRGAPGPTWTILRGEDVIGVGGVCTFGRGAWDAWCCLADVSRRDWPTLIKLASRVLSYAVEQLGARTIEATARSNDARAERCLERLGFRGRGVFDYQGDPYAVMHRSA